MTNINSTNISIHTIHRLAIRQRNDLFLKRKSGIVHSLASLLNIYCDLVIFFLIECDKNNNRNIGRIFTPSTVSALVVDKKVLISTTYYDLGELRNQAGSGDSDSI